MEEQVKFTKNKRLIDNDDGSHIGGSLGKKFNDDLINIVKLDKNGLTFLE